MNQHPLRQTLADELHTRPFHDFEGSGRFLRFIYLHDRGEDAILEPVNRWLEEKGRSPIRESEKFRREIFDAFTLRVERHSEFVTIGFVVTKEKSRSGLPKGAFDPAAHPELPLDLIESIEAEVFHAIWLEVGAKPPAGLTQRKITDLLDCRSAASSLIMDGMAQAHFSFDIDAEGYSRVMLFNASIDGNRMGRIVQRLVELETYRMLALLGLPLVRDYSPELGQVEKDLQRLTHAISQHISSEKDDVGRHLPVLSGLAAQIENLTSATSFRLSATKAYRDIFLSRLESINASRLDGHQEIDGFLDRRMMPAMQTCEAFSTRLESLSKRVERTGGLLQTHTEFIIQHQNTSLLKSMNSRASAQFRLQKTVEGLSVIAGTYYGVGLVGIIAKMLPLENWHIGLDLIKAGSTPFVALAIFWIIRRGSTALGKGSAPTET
ncbi:DUF3422 family protein [Alphaproteobacteria bacterium LSUCC0684]